MTYWEATNIICNCTINAVLGLFALLWVKVMKWLLDGDNGRWLINLFRWKRR